MPALQESLKAEGGTERAQAALSIWRLTNDATEVLPVLRKLLSEEDLEWEAIETLIALGPAATPAVPDLIRALEKDESAQIPAAEALGKIGPDAADALPALRKLLEHEDEQIREAAQKAIKAIEQAGGGRPEAGGDRR